MDEMLMTHLDECLAAIEAGESLSSCLARYPDETDDLVSLLRIAMALEKVPHPEPTPFMAHAAKTQFLSQVERRRRPIGQKPRRFALIHRCVRIAKRMASSIWVAPVRAFATVAASIALLVLFGGGVVFAASGSLPGDPLYGFKLLGEDLQHALTFGHDNRIRLEETFTERRQSEVRQLLTAGRQEEVEFGGLLRERSGNKWLIEGISVIVNANTRGHLAPSLNAFVEIHGATRTDGAVLAQRIEIGGNEIIGWVERTGSGRWQVAGHSIQVDDKSSIQDHLQPGDCVEVHARHFPDGTLLALEIERSQRCHDAPTDGEDTVEDETPAPAATESPEPTKARMTSQPAATPTPTRLPQPTEAPEPTVMPAATQTPERFEIPEPSGTPRPTETLKPTDEPEETDELDDEPDLTDEPDEPDDEPDLTDEPEEPEEPDDEPDLTEEPEEPDEPDDEPDPTEEPDEADEPAEIDD